MKANTSLFLTAGALALVLSGTAFGQSETISLNYEEVEQTYAGVEPDEIDARNTAALTGVEPDEIDARATDEEPAGLLLPAVQQVRAPGTGPQPLTPVFIEIDDVDGESTDNASQARPDVVTGAGTGTQPRANRVNDTRLTTRRAGGRN